jgi:hypothetical protein
MSAENSMFVGQWETGPFGAPPGDLETGSDVIACFSDPRHISRQR